MRTIKLSVYGQLTVTFLCADLLILANFASQMSRSLPWYQASEVSLLVLVVLICPVLIGVGTAQLVLGMFMVTSRATKALPFATAGTSLVLAALIDFPGTRGADTLWCGIAALCCVAAVVVYTWCAAKDVGRLFSKELRAPTGRPGHQEA